MSKSTVEKIIIAIVSPLIVAAVIMLFTNIGNAASKTELKAVKIEVKLYTDTELRNHMNIEKEKFEKVNQKVDGVKESIIRTEKMVEFLYKREMNTKN